MASRWGWQLYSISLLVSCPIFWRADSRASYDIVVDVMSRVPAKHPESIPDVAHVLSGYQQIAVWAAGARPFIDMHLGPPASAWHVPPAGSAWRGASVRDADATALRGLELTLERGVASDGHCNLHAQAGQRELAKLPIVRAPLLLAPILATDKLVRLEVICYRRGFFGWGAGNVPATAPLELRVDAPLSEALEQRITDAAVTGIEPDPGSLRWTAELKSLSADARSGSDGNALAPRHINAQAIDTRTPAANEDSVAFDELDATDHIVVRPTERYTSVFVLAGQSLDGHVAANVSGTRAEVGKLACAEGVFAVATADWNGLDLRVVAPEPHQRIRYRVLALSGAREPGAELVAWTIGTQLDWILGEHPPKNMVDSCVRSLLSALGTRISATSLDSMYGLEPSTRQLLVTLADLGDGQ